jgi:hypothetical protein
LLLGYSTGLCEGVAGVFGGVIASSAEVTGHTQKAELTTSLLGLSYERDFACTVFGVAIAGGASSWENDRCVENNLAPLGFENAHSEPEGTFFAAQAHVSRCYSRFWGSPTLYGDVRYAGLYLGDYDEKGSEGNFKTKERDVDYLTARVVVEPTIENRYTCWSAAPFVGVVGRYQLRGNGVEGELVGTPIYFSQDVQRSCLAGLFGVEASGIWSTLEWSIRLEGMMDGTNGSRFLAHAGAEWSF